MQKKEIYKKTGVQSDLLTLMLGEFHFKTFSERQHFAQTKTLISMKASLEALIVIIRLSTV